MVWITSSATASGSNAAAVGVSGRSSASGQGSSVGTFFPPPPLPYSFGIAASDAVKAEGNGGTTTFAFTVTRYGDASGAASIGWWSWAASSADPAAPVASPSDFGAYAYPTGTVNFAAGEVAQTLHVTVMGDNTDELDEAFRVHLNDLPFASYPLPPEAATSATATILNDDAVVSATWNVAPITTITNVGGDPQLMSVTEADAGTTALSFSVTRYGDLSAPASVQWAVVGSGTSAVNGADFQGGVLPGGILQFAMNQRLQVVTVYLAGDLTAEANEGYQFLLSNPSAGTSIDIGAAYGTIYDNDTSFYYGTVVNDIFNTSLNPKAAVIDASQGGDDTLTSGNNADTFILGAALTSRDKINGGLGSDTLQLQGNYSAGLSLGSSTVTNVEKLVLGVGFNYKITTNSATVASGATMTVDASALASINSANINGSSESNGRFVFQGGAGADVFTGGSQADSFVGGGGGDVMKGNSGADAFRYLAAGDSPFSVVGNTIDTSGIDKITSFQAGTDKLDLSALGILSAAQKVLTRSTSSLSTGAVNGTGFFGTAGVAVEQGSMNGTTTTRVFVDTTRDGNLGSGDMLIQLTGVSRGAFGTSSLVF